jgi:hypothetical protein
MASMAEKDGQASALDALADETAALYRRGLQPVVVFDLDDTLFSTDLRHMRILREFAEHRRARDPLCRTAGRLDAVRQGPLPYQILDAARAAGVEDSSALEELRDFWFARFFKDAYLEADEPIAGGADYCRELSRKGAMIVYMTGRDETMRRGTLGALERHGFPAPDGAATRLVLKPSFETPDLAFKTQALEDLARLGQVCGAFENEPLHVNLFGERFAEARLYLLDTKHSGKLVALTPRAHRIKDFLRS